EAAALLAVDPTDPAAQALVKAADLNGNGIIDPAGFGVDTGGAPVYLDMNGPIIHAQGFLDLNVGGVVELAGNFAFSLGATQNVNLVGGGTDTVTTMTIGASNVRGFVGWSGPYFNVDANGIQSVNSSAEGLSLSDVNVGVFVGLSTANLTSTGPAGYFAMHLSIGSFKTVGHLKDFLDVNATLSVDINVGVSLTSTAVIDFTTSQFTTATGDNAPLGAYQVDTGDPAHPVPLDFKAFQVTIEVAGAVTIKVNHSPVAALLGVFFVNIDSNSFKLFADAALRVGPDLSN